MAIGGHDVIPIRTWAKEGQDDSFDYPNEGGMETYFAKAFGDPLDEENGLDEENNENEENYQEDEEGGDYDEEQGEEENPHDYSQFDEFDQNEAIQQYLQSSAEYESGFEQYDGEDQNDEGDGEDGEDGDDGEYEEEEDGEEGDNDGDGDDQEENDGGEDPLPENPALTDLIGLISSYEEMKEEMLRESINSRSGRNPNKTSDVPQQIIPPEDAEEFLGENEEDTADIVNEYKDLLAYLASPKEGAGKNTSIFDNEFDMLFPTKKSAGKSQPTKETKAKAKSQAPSQQPPQQQYSAAPSKQSVHQHHPSMKKKIDPADNFLYFQPTAQATEDDNDDDEDDEDQPPRQSVSHGNKGKPPRKKSGNKKKGAKSKFFQQEPVVAKKSHPLIKKEVDKAKLAEAQRRHRAMLADMVNKRKAEEEELLALAAKAQEKRKKFKEVSPFECLCLSLCSL